MNRRTFVSAMAAGSVVPFGDHARAEPGSSPGFQLGSVTYNTLKDFDVETIIRVLEGAGFAAVELRTGHKHGVEPSIGADERKRVRQRFERSKIRLVSYGTTCRFQSSDPAERNRQLELAKQFVDLAHDTGAMGIKLQPMGFEDGVPRETSIRNFGASMHSLGDYGASRKVEIWMEVHGKVTAEPPVAAAIVKAAAHPNVGVCWNSNPEDVTAGSVKESFRLLQPWIRNVHLHELTDATYPWRELFGLLRAAKYDRYTFAEVAESREPERYLQGYRALWIEMNRS